MVVTREYIKQVNAQKLHNELVAAAFDIEGVSYDNGTTKCIIYLKDTEIKDPTSIVNGHIYISYKNINWRIEWQKTTTAAEKFKVIAKYLGHIDLTEWELENGQLQ